MKMRIVLASIDHAAKDKRLPHSARGHYEAAARELRAAHIEIARHLATQRQAAR